MLNASGYGIGPIVTVQLQKSPLQQFESGISASDIQCKQDLELIFKAENGSPACVKPNTAQKLIERGWTKSVVNSISQINSIENRTTSYSSNCLGKEVSRNQTDSLVVLLMSPNSTATVCTTYQFDYNWDSYPNKNIYERGIVHFGLNLGPKFNVTTTPNSLNIINASEGATFSVLYKISSSLDSKGIYDSIPWGSCEQYPLAVGYAASELKKSDFPLEMLLDRPCYNVIFHAASNKIISGMDYAEVIVNGQ